VGADTGSAGSVDIDPDSPAAAALGLTVILSGKGEVAAADGAASLGSTSLHSLVTNSLVRGTFDLV